MKNKKLIVATLFLLTFFVATLGAVPAPVLALIGKDLNVTNRSSLSLILTLPSLFMIPTTLISGALALRMSKKLLAYFGGALFLIGAFGPLFIDKFTGVLICRAILGLGCGILFPLPFAMIPDYIDGHSRHTVMGIVTAGGNVLAAITSVLSGIFGKVTWQHSFYLYAFGIVPLLLLFFFVPNVKNAEPASAAAGKKSGAPASSVYWYAVALLLFFATIQIVVNLMSSFIVSEGLGSATTAGNALALKTLGSFLTALCFGLLFGFLKKWSAFAAMTVCAAGYLMLYMSPGLAMLMGSMIVIGFGMGFVGPVLMSWAAMNSPNAVSLSYSIAQAGILLGLFSSSLLLKLFAILGGSAARTMFLYSAVLLGAMAAVFLAVAMRHSKEKVPALEEQQELVAN